MPEITDPALLSQLNGKQQSNAFPGIVIPPPKRPEPYQVEKDKISQSNEAERLDLSRQGNARDAARFNADMTNKPLERGDKLRDDFAALPSVKEYNAALGALMTGLQSAPDAAGDNALIYSYAKAMDPGSVVRESEMGMAAGTGSIIEGVVANLKKQFGMEGGGQLSPEIRNKLRREMNNRVAQLSDLYMKARRDFTSMAERQGVNPEDVVGDYASRPFWETYDRVRPEESRTQKLGAAIANLPQDGRKYTEEESRQFWNGTLYLDQDGNPLGPDGGFALNTETGERGLVGRVTDDSGATSSAAGPTNSEAFLSGVGDVIQGAGDLVGIAANPLNATINAVAGTELTTDLGQALRDATGLPDKNPGIVKAINRGGAGALAGVGIAGQVGRLPGLAGQVAQTVARSPGTQTLSGAAAGGTAQKLKDEGVGPVGQLGGALVAGATTMGATNALINAGQRFSGQPNALARAASDLDINMMPADAGGTGARMATGALGRTLGGIPIAEGAKKAVATAAAAKGRIASSVGDVTDNAGAGQAVRRGVDQFAKGSFARAEKLFEDISVDPDAQVQLGNTRGALEAVTRGFKSNPALSRLWANHPRLRATLEALTPKDVSEDGRRAFMRASQELSDLQLRYDQMRNAVTPPAELARVRQQIEVVKTDLQRAQREAGRAPIGGELSWQDMKRFRSIVGEITGQPGITSDGSDIAALRKLYAALTTDMEATAAKQGPRALTEFRRATQYWRGREGRLEDVFSTLLGNRGQRSDEQVFKQINTWASGQQGDFSRLARTIRSLPDDEANTVRATLIQRMGLVKASGQDATGEVFSPAEFSTQWRGLSPRAKTILFPDKQHRADLEKLALVTDQMKRASQYENFSNTSLGVNATAQGALALTNLPVAAALAGLQFSGGKLLASPRFANWLARMPENPRAQAKYIEQLGVIASREPALAGDARALQDHLRQTLTQSPSRAAAGEQENNAGPVPVQQ